MSYLGPAGRTEHLFFVMEEAGVKQQQKIPNSAAAVLSGVPAGGPRAQCCLGSSAVTNKNEKCTGGFLKELLK